MKILTFFVILLFSTLSFAERASVIKADNSCSGFVPDPDAENGSPGLGQWFGDIHAVGRDAGGDVFPGSGKITCLGHHYVELDRAGVAKGTGCAAPGPEEGTLYLTFDTVVVASPSGEALLTCQFKKTGTVIIPVP
jgi:hypothetical protein